MKLSTLAESLSIFRKYFKDGDGYHIGAEHDVIYVHTTDTPIEADDVERLVKLGWQQQDADIGDADEFEAAHYDPDEGWSCYT